MESFKETSTMIDPQSIMRFMPFSESPYKAPPGVAALEAKRQQGDTVLVEGIKTGSAVVVARINDPLYRSIDSRVRIVVVANLILEPNEAFVVPGTVIPLTLTQIKHGRKVEIKLPSSVYEFDVSNATVVDYNPELSEIRALTYGETKILVKDKNCVDGLEDEQPESLTSRIYVREPKFLSLHVLPHRNWALVINQPYEIQVEIYDAENQRITVGNNVFVETTFDPMFFRVDYSSQNGTYHYGVPIKKGSAFVKAILKKITRTDGSELELTAQPRVKAEMEIFQSIAINPKETVLPWDPNVQPKYELRWNPSGGSGSFVWSSTNTSVVTVSQSGTGKTVWFGSVNVTVSASANLKIQGHARVHVLPPTVMEIIPHIVEAEVGTAIQVPLAFYTVRPNDPNKTRVSYSSCGKLPFQVEVVDPNFEYDAKTHYPHLKPACVVLPVVGKTLGSSLVHVKYSVGELSFEDSVTVSTFKPLEVLEPINRMTVLAVGASRQVVFHGGPRPLLEKHAGFVRKLAIINETVAMQREIKLEEGSKDDLYVFEVTCREVGTTDAAFSIGNQKSSATENAVVRVAVVQVTCAEPSTMYFKVETPLKSKCPNDASAAQVVRVAVPNYENTLVSVIVKDSNGKKFDNISSLQFDWSSQPDLVGFSNSKHVITQAIHHDLGYIIPGKSYQTIVARDKSGNVEIAAEVKGYRDEILKGYSIRARKLSPQFEEENELRHAMDLQLVADVSVDPSTINVFNHPSAKVVIRIQDGSGHFEVDTGASSVVGVVYHESNKTLEVQPLAQGAAKIRVKDLCISSRKDAEVVVDVNGVGYIKVDVEDEIQLGDETIMQVSVYDYANNILSPEMLGLVRIQLQSPKSEVLQIQQFGKVTTDSYLRYRVKGKALGESTISFYADGHDEVMGVGSIKSVPKTISVFPPLKLSPNLLVMLVGSLYQITSYGGPQTNSQIQYSRDSEDVIQVSGGGLITGRVFGKTTVHGRAIDISSRKVYSADQVEVEVVDLKGVRIVSPLTHILSSEKMPLRVVGISDDHEIDTSLLLGGRTPIMTFSWSLSNKECGELVHPFEANGLHPASGDQVHLQFHAKRPGTATVKVVVTYQKSKFTAEVDISVVDQIALLNYPQNTASILMTPNTEISLRTNKDSDAIVSYTIQTSKDSKVVDKDKSVISVDANGNVQSNDLIGQAVVLITAVENFGLVQSRTLIVEVKRITYIMVTPSLPIHLKNKPNVLPRGIPIALSATYHDNTGRQFDSVSSNAKARPSRMDAIQVDADAGNHTFKVSTLTEERVSVKIHDDGNGNLIDYLGVSVGEALQPILTMNSVTVGDIVCFSCALQPLTAQSSQGHWSAHPAKSLKIDPVTGVAVALSPGNVVVTYQIGSVSLQSQSIIVHGVEKIAFYNALAPSYITNNSTTSIRYDIPVQIDGKGGNVYGVNCSEHVIQQNIKAPFSCDLTFDSIDVQVGVSQLFDVQPVFLAKQARYACRIVPATKPSIISEASVISSKFTLTTRLNDDAVDQHLTISGTRLSVQSQSLTVKFNPAIYVHSPELVLTTNTQVGGVVLTGLRSILERTTVIPSDDEYLEIRAPIRDKSKHKQYHDGQPGASDDSDTIIYPVKIKSKFWSSGLSADDRLSVKIVSMSTQQTIDVPIKIKIESGFSLKEDYEGVMGYIMYFARFFYVTVLVPFLALIMFVVVILGYRQFAKVPAAPTTMNTSVFVTSPQFHGSPHRYAPTPPNSASFSGSPSLRAGESPQTSFRLFSTQDTGFFGSPSK